MRPTSFRNFLRLRDSWPNNAVEIKGSKLDEVQAAQLIELISRYDVFVKFFAVDMATHGVPSLALSKLG